MTFGYGDYYKLDLTEVGLNIFFKIDGAAILPDRRDITPKGYKLRKVIDYEYKYGFVSSVIGEDFLLPFASKNGKDFVCALIYEIDGKSYVVSQEDMRGCKEE